ncbi:MAG: CDP-diacylglycerol--serine O-phosphatidyltransferase, partial [Bacteroidaceae bacterium]|nr:CDP-diacylglycerol--serine O-phosphatidyltransferase [Bacteroidaceae bacterium]
VQGFCDYIPFAAFLIAAFSGYRLAKFNLDERQTLGFIGLPTPANALFWASLAYSYETAIESSSKSIYFLLAGVLISCWLLVSEVPMFALKFKSFGVRENLLRFVYILLCIILLVFMGWAAIVWLIAVYIVLSIFFVRRHRRGRG